MRVRVNCPGPTVCRGDLRLSIVRGPQTSGATAAATRRRRKILLGKRGFRVPARQTAEVKVRLSGKGRRLLRRRERLTVLATARTQLPGGKEPATGLDSFVLTAQHGHKGR